MVFIYRIYVCKPDGEELRVSGKSGAIMVFFGVMGESIVFRPSYLPVYKEGKTFNAGGAPEGQKWLSEELMVVIYVGTIVLGIRRYIKQPVLFSKRGLLDGRSRINRG